MYVFNVVLALHIDTTALSDGTYELIPESDGGDLEAQVNNTVNDSNLKYRLCPGLAFSVVANYFSSRLFRTLVRGFS